MRLTTLLPFFVTLLMIVLPQPAFQERSFVLPELSELIKLQQQEGKHRVWIDCDPGNDDILALVLAGLDPNITIVGASSSAGNTGIQFTTQNTADILSFINEDAVNVYQGLPGPLGKILETATYIHGQNGLGGITFPRAELPLMKDKSLQLMAEKILSQKGRKSLTLIVTGPMTNIAILFTAFPEIKEKISHIICMGGSIGEGNVSPAAEFNFYVDPIAAKIVLSQQVPIIMMPLDLTHTVLVEPEIMAKLRQISEEGSSNNLAKKLYEVFEGLIKREKMYSGMESPPMHDPTTIYFLKHPEQFACRKAEVSMETCGDSQGRSNCWWSSKNPNAYVCDKTNEDGFWKYALESIRDNFNQKRPSHEL